jgi:hypothetical protein
MSLSVVHSSFENTSYTFTLLDEWAFCALVVSFARVSVVGKLYPILPASPKMLPFALYVRGMLTWSGWL